MLKPFEPQLLPIRLKTEDIVHLYKFATETRVKIERFNLLLERSPVKMDGARHLVNKLLNILTILCYKIHHNSSQVG